MKKLNILYLEDNVLDLELVKLNLNAEKIDYNNLIHAGTKKDFVKALGKMQFDIILSDYSLPEIDGLEVLKIVKNKYPDTPFIILSGSIGEEMAIETLKKGATDYVLKKGIKRLVPVIRRALKEKEENAGLKQAETIQKAIFNIANAVNATDSLNELIETIRFHLGKIIDTTNCYIAIYNEAAKILTLSYHKDEHDKEMVIPVNKTFTGYVVKTGKSLLANKNKIEELVNAGIVEIIGTPSQIWLGVPLKSSGKTTGVLVVQSYTDPNLYTRKDVEILEFISHHIALAIERKQYEDTLKKRNVFIENIINNIPIGLAVSSLDDGTVTFINPKFGDILGCRDTDIKNIHDFFNSVNIDKQLKGSFNNNFLRNLENSNSLNFNWDDVSIQSAGEEKKVVSIINIPLNKQNIFITALQDITKRVLDEEKISILTNAVKFSPASVVITDNCGFIEYVNPKFEEVSGYSSEEAIGKKTGIVKSGCQPDEVYKTLWETITTGKEWRGEFQNKKKSGELFWESVSISPVVNNKNEITHFIGVKEDITKRKRDEEILKRAKDKAEESDKLKSSFLANMSHEIRTPMNSIIGFSELLTEPRVSEDQKKVFVDQIHTNCDHLLHLIDDILDISKIEAGQMDIQEVELSLDKLLHDIFTYFSQLIVKSKKQIALKCISSQAYQNYTIITDSFRLKQIISNLVENAIKFTEKGYIEFGYSIVKNKTRIEFFVKDTGIGISEDKRGFIFERFSKIEDNKNVLYGGTGLGLTISKNLVKLLGGDIRVESTVGQGSVFYFTIPLKISDKVIEEVSPAKRDGTELNWKGKTILIAEDEESNYHYLHEILSIAEVDIVWARNGEEAVEIFRTNSKIDLVLMDIKMPEMDGYEATRQIKQINKDIPVIAQTAFAMTDEKGRCLKSGCNDFLSKPIRAKNLIALINKYF